ncbi:MAG TPA: hypothetical protein VI612_04060 [Candidatus Nanoarchaeia archaeon]|nr:hypothetical protein [Candidatus Nanoarchaeia archaeon]
MVLLPHHLRFADDNYTIAGIEPYYHARMAVEGSVSQPYDAVLSFAYGLFGYWAFRLVPAFFAFLSFILFWLFLRTVKVPVKVQVWILLAYALSPILVSLSLLGNPNGFALCSILLGAILLCREKLWFVGVLFFVIAALSGALAILASLAFLLVLGVWLGFSKNVLFALGSVALLLARESPPTVDIPRSLLQFVSDLGGIYGLSLFAILLSIVGIALVWSHKRNYYSAFAVSCVFFIISFFFPSLLVYANIMVSGLVGVALARLAERKWKLSFLRNASLLVLFCGLLFSSIAHANALADLPPVPEFFEVLDIPEGVVLTHESYGFWVEFSGHKAVIDPFWKRAPDAEALYWDVTAMFSSASLEDTMFLLRKYDVDYVLLSREMRRGLVWERDEQGLAFVVANSERFKKIKEGVEFEVWKVR